MRPRRIRILPSWDRGINKKFQARVCDASQHHDARTSRKVTGLTSCFRLPTMDLGLLMHFAEAGSRRCRSQEVDVLCHQKIVDGLCAAVRRIIRTGDETSQSQPSAGAVLKFQCWTETGLLVIPFTDVCKGHVVQVLVSKQPDSQPKASDPSCNLHLREPIEAEAQRQTSTKVDQASHLLRVPSIAPLKRLRETLSH